MNFKVVQMSNDAPAIEESWNASQELGLAIAKVLFAESNTIQFDLTGEDFRIWNEEKGDWELEAGEFEIQAGKSSQNILLKEKI